ncbi:MAG: DUF2059 domain-containing protein [Halocynthiibacter sp.]
MKMMLRSLTVVACLLGQSVFAGEREDLAKEYVQLPAVQTLLMNVYSPDATSGIMQSMMPPGIQLSEDQLRRVGELMAKHFTPLIPHLETSMEKTAAEVFTVEELKAMIEFYSSSAGESILGKSNVLMQKSMAEMAPHMMGAVQKLQPEMVKILSEK